MLPDILRFHSPRIFQPLKQIQLILGVHAIDIPAHHALREFSIGREPRPVFLTQQCIFELFYIVVLAAVHTNDLPVQQQEYLVQCVCGEVADHAAEDVILRCSKYFIQPLCGNGILLPQPQRLQKKRAGNCGRQSVKPVDTPVQPFVSRIASKQDLIPLCVAQQIFQKQFHIVSGTVLHIPLERCVNPVYIGRALLLHT